MKEPAAADGFALTLADGERGRALGFVQGVLRMACARSHPPGQPLALLLTLPGGELRLEGKSAGSKRRPDGEFDVQLRLHSLRREQREQLERAFSPPN